MQQLVSIIVLTYNSEKFVIETLNSIKAQSYSKIELIISDDCSSDETVTVCTKWIESNEKRFCRTKIITAPNNTGIPANCNRGIKDSEGQWIKLIAGDDLLFPDAIDIFMNEVQNDDSLGKLAFHGKVVEFGNNAIQEPVSNYWDEPVNQIFNKKATTPTEQFNILLRFCPVSATTVLLNKNVFDEIGYFDERFKFWEDRPMWLKITSHGIKMHFINSYITKYRRHNESVQLKSNKILFSRTQMSKDDGSKILIVPHLPFHERLLNLYIFAIRSFFYKMSRNKKTFLINVPYRIMVIFAEKLLIEIKNQHSP